MTKWSRAPAVARRTSPKGVWLLPLPRKPNAPDPYGIRNASRETAANTLICLINQATYLLHRQLEKLERDFLDHGGFTERLYAARTRNRCKVSPNPDAAPVPSCPQCGKPMVQRTARKGSHRGQPFWGCSVFPACSGIRPFHE